MEKFLGVLITIALMLQTSAAVTGTLSNKISTQYSVIGQSGAMSSTTLFTALQTGVFIVKVFEQSNAGADITMNWTDANGSQSLYYSDEALSDGFVRVIQVSSGQTLSFSTDSPGSGNTYSLFITVDQIQ